MTEENPEEELFSAPKHRIRELEQEVEIMGEYISIMGDKGMDKEQPESSQHTSDLAIHRQRESEQEKLILKELNKALEEKADLEIGHFLNMISHELKTPLVPIKAYTEMLQEGSFGEVSETQKQKLKAIDDNTKELINLTSNIIDYRKFSLGIIKLHKERNDIKEIIRKAYLFFSTEFNSHGMITKSTFNKQPLWIICDAKRMYQVITNLLQIALYSIPKKSGKVSVQVLENEKEEVEIRIKHNGKTISGPDINKIFSKFYQVDTSNIRSNGGIGLALALCKQIIEAHGGKIWLEKDDRQTISFTLPNDMKNYFRNNKQL